MVFAGDDGKSFTLSYATLIGLELGMLYSPEGPATISAMLSDVHTLIQQPAALRRRLGPRRVRLVGLRHRRRREVSAHEEPACQGHACMGDQQPFTAPPAGPSAQAG